MVYSISFIKWKAISRVGSEFFLAENKYRHADSKLKNVSAVFVHVLKLRF